jgi:hypothetical protein
MSARRIQVIVGLLFLAMAMVMAHLTQMPHVVK